MAVWLPSFAVIDEHTTVSTTTAAATNGAGTSSGEECGHRAQGRVQP
jgi:hypothetical protein